MKIQSEKYYTEHLIIWADRLAKRKWWRPSVVAKVLVCHYARMVKEARAKRWYETADAEFDKLRKPERISPK